MNAAVTAIVRQIQSHPVGTAQLTTVGVDSVGQAQVLWSRARGRKDAQAKGADVGMLIDPQLRRPNTQIIMSEAL